MNDITRKLSAVFFALTLMGFSAVSIASAVTDRYIEQLVNGGPQTIRGVAQSIYNTGERDEKLLDVLSEVLLQNYTKGANIDIDANAWASKALGNSANGRYRSVLEEVVEKSGNRKLNKHAKRALKALPTDGSKQYARGSVSLDKLKNSSAKKSTSSAAPKQAASGGKQLPITEVKVGMDIQQVYSMCGQPTATTSHETGKRWIPFNYKGGDVARQIAIYKGQGRVIFSNVSAYSSEWRVKEIQLNANESGYP